MSKIDLNIRKSRDHYQVLSISKQLFETSNLNKHPIKNLQTTINMLTDQEENEKADTEEVPDKSIQKKLTGHSFLSRSSKSDKGKGKDTGDQSSLRKIPPASEGRDDGNSSSSEEEPDRKKLWHPKSCRKISVPTGDNTQEQAKNRERIMVE